MSAVLLLCSGGLDSTTVAYWLRERGIAIVPIFFDYGQHCVEKEWLRPSGSTYPVSSTVRNQG
jgi:7-cyano-7-deazaguanine synthase